MYASPGGQFEAADLVDGVPIDPVLPPRFDETPNVARPRTHQVWWRLPFIVTCSCDETHPPAVRANWLESWPNGTRYDVRCLDGGAWDRSTWWGSFATLIEAIERAKRPIPSYIFPVLGT
jgi:hypothetical protein